MTYLEFLANLTQNGVINSRGAVTDQCSIQYTAGDHIVDVRALSYESDIDEGDAMIVYLDSDVELAFYTNQFDIELFKVIKKNQILEF